MNPTNPTSGPQQGQSKSNLASTSSLPGKAMESLRTEYRCDLNLPQAHLSIYSDNINTVQDMIRRLEPKAVFKQAGTGGDEHQHSLLVFNTISADDPQDAIGVISELDVPRNWNISRNQMHRVAA